jgi:hypothetical protein
MERGGGRGGSVRGTGGEGISLFKGISQIALPCSVVLYRALWCLKYLGHFASPSQNVLLSEPSFHNPQNCSQNVSNLSFTPHRSPNPSFHNTQLD